MKKFLALLLAFVMVAAMAVTVFADPVVDSEQEEGETYEYTSTRVQGFSSYRRSEWKDAGKYNDYEAQYVVECTAPTNGNDGNRGRYCDADTYVIWKFEAKDAETAKFLVNYKNEAAFAVSKDGENWTEFFTTGGERVGNTKGNFDLTEYLPADYLYIKAYDSKPVYGEGESKPAGTAHGWGAYIYPTGTYFVTTQTKTANTADDETVNVSFTHWDGADEPGISEPGAVEAEYTQYVLSEFYAGITGGTGDKHPFFDRNIGENPTFGGPQIVYAFPTNPNHKYAAANLRLSSYYLIEVSTDFENWTLVTAKDNRDMTGSGKYFDLSPYMGGTDMIFVKVRSPEDMGGNGPQIHTNAPIEFTSNNYGDEILWDDCSTDEHFNPGSQTHKMAYNEELNAVAVDYNGQGNLILRYGKGDTEVDIRTMKYFEFDVYVSEKFSKGYNNAFVLELLDGPVPNDDLEYQYTDFVIYEGWTHVVLPLPATFIRKGSGGSGNLNWGAIRAFRFFSTTETDAYTLAFRNMKFTRSTYVPGKDGTEWVDWNNVTPNANTWVKQFKDFSLDISKYNVVELDVYSADPKAWNNYGCRFELSSYGNCDHQEQEETVNEYIYNAGWNHVIIPLTKGQDGEFDHTNLNWVRVHAQIGSGNIFSFRNVKFSYMPEFVDMINNSTMAVKTPYNKTNVVQKNDGSFSMNLKDANYIAMDVYFQDPQAFMNNGAYVALEFCSKNACDQEEYQFTFGAKDAHTYSCSVDVSDLKPGWNHIELPIYIADVSNGPVQDDIIYTRIHVHTNTPISKAGAGWVAFKNIRAIAVDQGNQEAGIGMYGIVDPAAELVVTTIANDEVDEDLVNEFIADITENCIEEGDKNKYNYDVVKAFDISLMKEDAEIQPDGTVKLVLPKYEVLSSETLYIYHVHGDQVDRLDYEKDANGNIIVYLDSFSSLIYVKQAQFISGNPYTGDMIVMVLAIVAVLAAGAFVFVLKKSRV